MNTKKRTLGGTATLSALVATLAALLLSSNLQAADFVLVQGGYAEGATVTVTFTGEDLNEDGQIVYLPNSEAPPGPPEITALTFSFSGNSVVPAFTRGFDDFFGLVFALDGSPLGDDDSGASEGVGINLIDGFDYVTGPGPLNLCDGTNVCGRVKGPGGAVDTTRIPLGGSGYSIDGSTPPGNVPVATSGPERIPTLPFGGLLLLGSLMGLLGWRKLS